MEGGGIKEGHRRRGLGGKVVRTIMGVWKVGTMGWAGVEGRT